MYVTCQNERNYLHAIKCTHSLVRHTLKIVSEENRARGIPLKKREREREREKDEVPPQGKTSCFNYIYVGVSCMPVFLFSNSDVLR